VLLFGLGLLAFGYGCRSSRTPVVEPRPKAEGHELLDLRDGNLVRPRIETPDGAAREWWMALDEQRVWLIARTPRDTTSSESGPSRTARGCRSLGHFRFGRRA